MDKKTITIQATVNAPIEKVWEYWNKPEHIVKWAFASDDWEAPRAENDLRVSGKFKTHMQAKDGSAGFDFTGAYTAVKEHELIEYDIDDYPPTTGKRHVKVEFDRMPEGVQITTAFEPERQNSEEMQHSGWQAIMDNFKKYVESN